MPGVPSYRGCDACRKQKKKCDMASPACSRCSRLNIPCVGCGQLRYKFKDQTDLQAERSSKKARNRTSGSGSGSESPPSITSLLSNRDTARSGAFVSLLDVTDPSYDLRCYGPWFKDLPRRLGINTALDAAVEAMVGFYPHLRRHEQSSLSRGSVVKYVNALQALRTCLNDPQTANKPETLCAVYVLMICQGWTGRDSDQQMSHGEGLAHLLDAAASKKNPDAFEATIRDTLYIPVVIEAIFNPKIRLSPWFQKLKRRVFGPAAPLSTSAKDMLSLELRNLVHIPDLLREPAKYKDDIAAAYERMRVEIPLLKGALEMADALAFETPTPATAKIRIQYQVSLGLLMGCAMIYNGYLRAFGVDDGSMVEEADRMANDAIKLAHDASQYRPLGASFVPLCLVPGWAATDNIDIQHRVVQALEIYQNDFSPLTSRSWYIMAYWLKGEMDLIRSGLQTSPPENYNKTQWGTLMLDEKGNVICGDEVTTWFYA
ncbi:uncharacterized protein TRIVIDRAFT_52617 [Trichoderma virens Gv29-8]|uniref:Zn(2)-C6 fungal-type domain-containing protein n=1 Tax=Hypocrea virens (strain Gv29-8 / FGSC 10586) TaxID=413071 RepID=G9MVT0_HYPVG|nr:uncharacterized protein TRIVIDRAFT_52617 [Trichoderma virens Gv29-8]EHK21405.1 hypothetical protein TRIVIDRAFT_52617 [Trichoderma virens Gv29-8]UKZ53360.1 hypothetical protein TrVGV298_007152 [Trichoderma virens]